jgi:hypothetical protein
MKSKLLQIRRPSDNRVHVSIHETSWNFLPILLRPELSIQSLVPKIAFLSVILPTPNILLDFERF